MRFFILFPNFSFRKGCWMNNKKAELIMEARFPAATPYGKRDDRIPFQRSRELDLFSESSVSRSKARVNHSMASSGRGASCQWVR